MFGRSLSDESDEPVTIDLSSMIDCIFILLIFFIVSTVFVEETGVDGEQAGRRRGERAGEATRSCWPSPRDDKVFYGGESIGVQGVIGKIKPLLTETPDMPVIIQGDKDSTHGIVQQVHGQAMLAGAMKDRISISTQVDRLGVSASDSPNDTPRLPPAQKQAHRHVRDHRRAARDHRRVRGDSALAEAHRHSRQLHAHAAAGDDRRAAGGPGLRHRTNPRRNPNRNPNPRRWSRNRPISISASTSADLTGRHRRRLRDGNPEVRHEGRRETPSAAISIPRPQPVNQAAADLPELAAQQGHRRQGAGHLRGRRQPASVASTRDQAILRPPGTRQGRAQRGEPLEIQTRAPRAASKIKATCIVPVHLRGEEELRSSESQSRSCSASLFTSPAAAAHPCPRQPHHPAARIFSAIRSSCGSSSAATGFLSDVEPQGLRRGAGRCWHSPRVVRSQSKFTRGRGRVGALHQGDRDTDRPREAAPRRSARRWSSCWATSTSRPTAPRRRGARFWRRSAASRASAAPTPTSPILYISKNQIDEALPHAPEGGRTRRELQPRVRPARLLPSAEEERRWPPRTPTARPTCWMPQRATGNSASPRR